MISPIQVSFASGSKWRRWDPHLHAPGTLLNDQFNGNWAGYLDAIETATPSVEVLGVTDYFSIGCYREVRKQHQAGRLPSVKLLFPNVELRLDLATEKKQPINLHLLFSPEDNDHEEHIERLLASLVFEYKGRKYHCSHADLLTLGRVLNTSQKNDHAARCEAANQFKVTLDQLRDLFRGDSWIVRHCLVAVSASSNDGTAGVQQDDSFAAWRKEVERFAQVIFSPTQSVREFWLGKHPKCNGQIFEQEHGGRKPCLHGSDAHCVEKTPVPDRQRYCWIKGDPTFESLRQAILEPDERVSIGVAPPDRHDAQMCIASITTSGTPWLSNNAIQLNPGLVAIIGSRGSGKTALADILAIGANVLSPHALDSSFLRRASCPVNYLEGAEVELRWGDNTPWVKPLNPDPNVMADQDQEGVRYLSQQFVEQLCSAEGLAVELRREIERVIFEATDALDRFDADSFEQLSEIHLAPIRRQREALQEAIENTSSEVVAEDRLFLRLEPITKDRDTLAGRITKTTAEMTALVPKGEEVRAKRLAELETAVTAATTTVDKQKRARVRVEDLQKELKRLRSAWFPQLLAKLRTDFQETGLSADEWQAMTLRFSGEVDQVLARRIDVIDGVIRVLTEGNPSMPVDPRREPIGSWPLAMLVTERDKVKAEVGIDAQKQRRYGDLRRALEKDERLLQRANAEFENANGAHSRRQAHLARRRELYAQVFQSFLDEQNVLVRLYGPLQHLLETGKGSLSRLRFSVSRGIDLDAWIKAGEELLDLRRESQLRGHGALRRHAERQLYAAWKTGTADNVAAAVQKFIQELYPDILKSMPASVEPARTSEWQQQVASWLYSTAHIQMRYSVMYDGVAIEHLSPGTRGIVLLLLYLVIDKHDQRPLIIDQPEENLDPKSIFEELVPHFREARQRRQVIIVTHNANLVVNTDADQVIVASSEPKDGIGLPTVSYHCGSLEDPEIRKSVCNILEGGERAFLDRERRYRLHWDTRQ